MPLKVKHGGTWKDPKDIYVKKNGSWVKIDKLYTKRNGTWQESYSSTIPPLVLIDYGTKSSLLGGFTYDDCWNPPGTSGVGTTGSYFYNDGDGLSVNAPYWGCGTATSNNNVNIAGAVSVTYSVSWSGVDYYGGGSFGWRLANGNNQDITIRSTGGSSSGSAMNITVPLSSAGGNGPIYFGVGNTNGGRIYLHKLQFNYA